jgi:putative membrane protein
LFTFAAMNIFIKIIISSLAVLLTAYLLPGIHVDDYIAALVAAAVLALLNGFLKPVLVLLTIPFTVFTLGLFLLVINAAMVMLASRFVSGFEVDGFWWALLFSIVLSVVTSIMESLGRKPINGRH